MPDNHTQGISIHEKTDNACLKKLWPECVHDYKGFTPDEMQHDVVIKSVKLAKVIIGEGFDGITCEEFNDIINAHTLFLFDKNLAELTKSTLED